MNRRWVNRWLRDWGLMLMGMVVLAAVLWDVTRDAIFVGVLLSSGSALVLVVIGWLATR